MIRSIANQQKAMHPGGLRRKQAAEYCGISIRTMHRLVAEGNFPMPKKIPGSRICIWAKWKLDAWLNN